MLCVHKLFSYVDLLTDACAGVFSTARNVFTTSEILGRCRRWRNPKWDDNTQHTHNTYFVRSPTTALCPPQKPSAVSSRRNVGRDYSLIIPVCLSIGGSIAGTVRGCQKIDDGHEQDPLVAPRSNVPLLLLLIGHIREGILYCIVVYTRSISAGLHLVKGFTLARG